MRRDCNSKGAHTRLWMAFQGVILFSVSSGEPLLIFEEGMLHTICGLVR